MTYSESLRLLPRPSSYFKELEKALCSPKFSRQLLAFKAAFNHLK